MAGEHRSGSVQTWAARLAPLLVILLLQLVVISRSGPSKVHTEAAGPADEALAAGDVPQSEAAGPNGSAASSLNGGGAAGLVSSASGAVTTGQTPRSAGGA